jgi:hypothetical protein
MNRQHAARDQDHLHSLHEMQNIQYKDLVLERTMDQRKSLKKLERT